MQDFNVIPIFLDFTEYFKIVQTHIEIYWKSFCFLHDFTYKILCAERNSGKKLAIYQMKFNLL